MGRAGFSISQQGAPIDRAADYQKVLDDRWAYLDIADEREYGFTLSDFSSDRVDLLPIYKHDLGYIPGFTADLLEYETDAPTGLAAGTSILIADDEYIYAWCNIFSSGFFSTSPVRFKYLVRTFAVDITREYKQPVDIIAPAPNRTKVRFGARILRPGKTDITSQNIDDFTLNTNAKALSVYQTGVATADSGGIMTINHGIGYPPIFLLAQYATDNTYLGGVSDVLNGKPRVTRLGYELRCEAGAQSLVFQGGQSQLVGSFAFLILKDPLETNG